MDFRELLLLLLLVRDSSEDFLPPSLTNPARPLTRLPVSSNDSLFLCGLPSGLSLSLDAFGLRGRGGASGDSDTQRESGSTQTFSYIVGFGLGAVEGGSEEGRGGGGEAGGRGLSPGVPWEK